MASVYYVLDPKGMAKAFATVADARIYIANMIHRGIKLPTFQRMRNQYAVYRDLMTPVGIVIVADAFYWVKWEDYKDDDGWNNTRRILPSGNLARY